MSKKLLMTVKTLSASLLLASAAMIINPAVAADKPSTKGDVGRGAKAWVENCVRCHNVRDPKELRDDQWITTTYHMRMRAGLTGQQTRDIIAFLQMSN